MIALLACAVAAVIGAEWPRLSARYGNEARRRRERTKRKSQLKLLRTETEEFAASADRDPAQPPTRDENDRNSQRTKVAAATSPFGGTRGRPASRSVRRTPKTASPSG